MPFDRQFFPEQHLLYERAFGTLTLDEIAELHQGEIKAIEQANFPIHVLVDLRLLEHFPASLIEIKNKVSVIENQNLRWMILVINTNRVLKFLASVVMQIIFRHARYRVVNSMDEAVAFLEDMDSTLDLSSLPLQIEHAN